jgi:hypothetical protein
VRRSRCHHLLLILPILLVFVRTFECWAGAQGIRRLCLIGAG